MFKRGEKKVETNDDGDETQDCAYSGCDGRENDVNDRIIADKTADHVGRWNH